MVEQVHLIACWNGCLEKPHHKFLSEQFNLNRTNDLKHLAQDHSALEQYLGVEWEVRFPYHPHQFHHYLDNQPAKILGQ